MKREKTGFTLVELLTVLAIVAMLVGLLIPSLNLVRNTAKEAKQKAQLTEIGLALTAFRNDHGDYPPSNWRDPPPTPGPGDYCGAQKLAEALLGWDLLGFHPKSDFRANGNTNAGVFIYDTANPMFFDQRRGPYLELATTNAFRLGNNPARQDPEGLFPNSTPLNPDRYVICDSFGVKKVTIAPGVTAKAGTPILYYRANTASKTIVPPPPTPFFQRIYNVSDNMPLTTQLTSIADGQAHKLGNVAGGYEFFYGNPTAPVPVIGYIQDPKVTARPWPYRPDSYLLISAGIDGIYGTSDDICNFGN